MRILIIGYGVTGKAVERFLKAFSHEVFIYDKTRIDDDRYLSYERLKNQLPLFDIGIRSPGISVTDEAWLLIESLCLEVMSELDFAFLHLVHPKIVAITGSNGKTTLASDLYHFISADRKVFLAGNIGKPLIDIVPDYREGDLIILEVSSFQLRDSHRIAFDDLFVTSIGPNHLNMYPSVFHYYADKKRALSMTKGKIYYLGKENAHFPFGNYPMTVKDNRAIEERIEGTYAKQYALIALNYALDHSENPDRILKRAESLAPVRFRMNRMAECGGFQMINDAKSTTAESSAYCYDTYRGKGKIYLILGGIHKSGNFSDIRILPGDEVLIYGRDAKKISAQIPGKTFVSLEEIFSYLSHAFTPAIILFSPGCDSHDQYRSYVERGECFEHLVGRYLERSEHE